MFVLSNFLVAVTEIINIGLWIYMWVIVARAVISWVNPDPYNPIVRFLYQATEPVLYQVRRVLPYMGGLDISPVIVIFAIYFFRSFLVRTLMEVAFRMKGG